MRLPGCQTHFHASVDHGFQKIKHISGPRTRHSGDGIKQSLLFHPKRFTHQSQHAADGLFLYFADGISGKQTGLPQTHQGGRIGHGAHHPLGVQPCRDAVAADASGHAQMQGIGKIIFGLQSCFFEDLRFDRPDHHGAVFQRSVCCCQYTHAVLCHQSLAGGF